MRPHRPETTTRSLHADARALVYALVLIIVALLLGAAPASAAPPANDDFANAVELVLGGDGVATTIGSTYEATGEVSEPDLDGAPNTVWYRWTALTSSKVTVDLAGCAFDSFLHVYSGTLMSALSVVGSDDDGAGSRCSAVSFAATAGTTYMVRVDGFNAYAGRFPLRLAVSNDDFEQAYPLVLDANGIATADGTNVGATGQPGEPGGAGTKHTMWYAWTATSTAPVTIELESCNFDSYITVLTGSALNTLTVRASDDDSGVGYCSLVNIVPTVGVTYWIQVDGLGNTSGQYRVRVSTGAGAASPNDGFASAVALTLDGNGRVEVSGTTVGATGEAGEYPANGASNTVWYNWTATTSTPITIDTVGCSVNTQLDVFTGPDVISLTPVASNDDITGTTCSSLQLVPTTGTTYRIRVDGAGSQTGAFVLRMSPIPGNDSFAAAAPLALDGGGRAQATGTLLGATSEVGEPASSGALTSVWYSWIATIDSEVVIDTIDCSVGTYVRVFSGVAVGSLTTISTNGNWTDSACSVLRFTPVVGVTYWIQVDGKNNAVGEFPIRLTSPVPGTPPNDMFRSAESIVLDGSGSATVAGTTSGATGEIGEYVASGAYSTVWYRWVATAGTMPVVDTAGCATDTVLSIFSGSIVSELTHIGTDDDSAGGGCSQLEFVPSLGTTYWIRIDGKRAASGAFSLHITQQPAGPQPNDMFAGAEELVLDGSGFATTSGNNTGATREVGEPAGSGAVQSLWYKWVATAGTQPIVDTIGCVLDTSITVYSGSSVSSLSNRGSDEDSGGAGCSRLEWSATEGVTYWIRVDGAGAATGAFTLNLRRQLPGPQINDMFTGAEALVLDDPGTTSASGTNVGATSEVDERAGSGTVNSVWYTWVATPGTNVVVELPSCDFNSYLQVFHGTSLTSLTYLGYDDDSGPGLCSRYELPATVGQTYWFRVDGNGSATGSFTISLSRPEPSAQPNDMFAGAEEIVLDGSGSAGVTGTTADATSEVGESSASGVVNSIWYTWVATPGRRIVVDTAGCEFDTYLYVYRGTALNALTLDGWDNDSAGATCSRYSFMPTIGTTYWFRIDGANGATGSTPINVARLSAPQHNDLFGDAEVLVQDGAGVAFGDGTLVDALDEASEPAGSGTLTTLWYRWTASSADPVQIDTNGCSIDTVIDLFQGSAINSLAKLAGDDDSGSPTTCSKLVFVPESGATYSIRVDGKNALTGAFTLVLKPYTDSRPANDDFANAEQLTLTAPGGSVSGSATTIGATYEAGEPVQSEPSNSVWYRWDSPATSGLGAALTTSCPAYGKYAMARVYTGPSLNALTPINKPYAYECLTERFDFPVVANTTYWIQIDTYAAQTNVVPWTLSLFAAPVNDDFLNASPIVLDGSGRASVDGTNVGATRELAEPSAYSTVWYRWDAPIGPLTDDQAFLTLPAYISYGTIAVFAGSSSSSLVTIADPGDYGSDAGASFTPVPGATYYIRVSSRSNGDSYSYQNAFTLEMRYVQRPGNDDFAHATALTLDGAGTAIADATDVGATREVGEPAGWGVSHSIWFDWTPTVDETVEISVPNCSQSVNVQAFVGTQVNALTAVANPYTYCYPLALSAKAGVTYRIRTERASEHLGPVRVQVRRTSGSPANDDFANAEPITLDAAGLGAATGTLVGSSREAGEPAVSTNMTVWYAWTATSAAPLTICATESVQVFTGSTVGALNTVALTSLQSSNGDSACQSRHRLSPVSGTTYWIRQQHDYFATPVTVKLQQHLQAPPNDNFASATALVSVNGTASAAGTTVRATGEGAEPPTVGGPDSVWYSWTAPDAAIVQVDTSSCLHDTVLVVYSGATLNSLVPVASDDNSGHPTGIGCSSVSFTPTAGTTYFFRVEAKAAVTDEFSIKVNQVLVPANDDYANAQSLVLSSRTVTVNGTTTAATGQLNERNYMYGGNGQLNTVWYRWTATHGSPLDISTLGCTSDTYVEVFTEASMPTGTSSYSTWYNDNGPAGHGRCSLVTIPTPNIGTTYYIRVDGAGNATGAFPLQLTQRTPPAHDEIASPSALSGWVTSTMVDATGASKATGEAYTGSASVWYSWTATQSGPVAVNISHCTAKTVIQVRSTQSYSGPLRAASAGYSDPKCNNLTFTATSGTTYYIGVGFYDSSTVVADPTYRLSINRPPNDDFAGALPLAAFVTSAYVADSANDQYNVGASLETDEPAHAGDTGGASVWYSFTPTVTQQWSVDTFGPNTGGVLDTLLAVYTGSAVDGLTPVGSSDDSPGSPIAGHSRVVFTGVQNTTYWIAVDGKGAAMGRFGLRVGGAPPLNDDLGNAEPLSGSSFTASGTLNLGSLESVEPAAPASTTATASVWYSYTAPSNGWLLLTPGLGQSSNVTIDAFEGAAYPLTAMGVNTYARASSYSTSGCSPAMPGPRPRIPVVAGTTYSIRVANTNHASNGFPQFTLRGTLNGAAPANDSFTGAIPLDDNGGACFDTLFATSQAGEALPHAGTGVGGVSLWYSWTPSKSGSAQIVTSNYRSHRSSSSIVSGQVLDPVLAVYTGTSVNALTPVASNDDASYDSAVADVRFMATAGVTYRIAVDMADGAGRMGAITINPTPASGPGSMRDGLGADISTLPDGSSLSGNLSSVSTWFAYDAIEWAAYRSGYGKTCDDPEYAGSSASMSFTQAGPIADGRWITCSRTRSTYSVSSWASSNGATLDTGAMAPDPLSDGADALADVDYQSNTGSLQASWAASRDTAGVFRYETCFGSAIDATGCTVFAPGGSWVNVGTSLNHSLTGLTLAEGSLWYVCVRTTDGLGKMGVACTDGSMIDTFAPTNPALVYDLSTTFSNDLDLKDGALRITASWGVGADAGSGVRDYQACISTSAATCTVAPGTTIQNGITSRVLDVSVPAAVLVNASTLYTCVRTHDVAGNPAAGWVCSDGYLVDTSVPLVPTHIAPVVDSMELTKTPTLTASYLDPTPGTPGRLDFRVGTSVACGVGVVATGSTATPVASATNGSWTMAPQLARRYYWCARAVDDAGNMSAWSAATSFVVVGTATIDVSACGPGAATSIDSIAPGASLTTAAPCTIGFGANDGTSMLRMRQTDGVGTALTGSNGTPINDFGSQFNAVGAFGVCVEDLGADTVSPKPAVGSGKCRIESNGAWGSVPTAARKIAATTSSGITDATASVRFGVRIPSGFVGGTATAGITWEVLAPNL